MVADEIKKEELLDWGKFFKQIYTKRSTDTEKLSFSYRDIVEVGFSMKKIMES